MFCCGLFFFFISSRDLRALWLITAKFCTMLGSVFSFISLVQNFKRLHQKILGAKKHAKFGLISVDFKL